MLLLLVFWQWNLWLDRAVGNGEWWHRLCAANGSQSQCLTKPTDSIARKPTAAALWLGSIGGTESMSPFSNTDCSTTSDGSKKSVNQQPSLCTLSINVAGFDPVAFEFDLQLLVIKKLSYFASRFLILEVDFTLSANNIILFQFTQNLIMCLHYFKQRCEDKTKKV